MNKHKQEREQFYRQLFAVLSEPPKRKEGVNRIFRKAYEITQAYNARYIPGTNDANVAAALTHLMKLGIVKKIPHYEGAWWYLVEGASIEWLFDQE